MNTMRFHVFETAVDETILTVTEHATNSCNSPLPSSSKPIQPYRMANTRYRTLLNTGIVYFEW